MRNVCENVCHISVYFYTSLTFDRENFEKKMDYFEEYSL